MSTIPGKRTKWLPIYILYCPKNLAHCLSSLINEYEKNRKSCTRRIDNVLISKSKHKRQTMKKISDSFISRTKNILSIPSIAVWNRVIIILCIYIFHPSTIIIFQWVRFEKIQVSFCIAILKNLKQFFLCTWFLKN